MKIGQPPNKKEPEEEKDRDVRRRPPPKPEELKPRAPVVTVSLTPEREPTNYS